MSGTAPDELGDFGDEGDGGAMTRTIDMHD
jgi:hypothetical protein